MGDVISIKRSTDDDLFSHFEAACPQVPPAVENSIRLSANRAIGGEQRIDQLPSFKYFFVAIAGLCVIGMLLANGVTSRWKNAVQAAAVYSEPNDLETLATASSEPGLAAAIAAELPSSDGSFIRARGAWAEYISRLERDPYYQYVLAEKRRFAAQYPEQ